MKDLTPISEQASEHTQKVSAFIREIIETEGPISFARYMELALYAPGLGYYSAGTQKFGKSGDFFTAPEISPLFSQCLAQQCLQILGMIPNAAILEFGAGTGKMALEILKTLEHHEMLPEKYYILELSADLKDRQQTLFKDQIPHLLHKIEWLSSLQNFAMSGIVLANEILDAMPVHRMQKKSDRLQEFFVAASENKFVWEMHEASSLVKQVLQNFPVEISDHYVFELNLNLPGWLNALSKVLQQGVCLIIDYGYPESEYFHEERSMGTLMCHYCQRAHDNPLIMPGIQDITAHVNFTQVISEAVRFDFDLIGYTTQAHFLLGCGITKLVQESTGDLDIASQLKLLMLPSEMGEIFKVMALGKKWNDPLLGFSVKDLSEKL